MFEAIAFYFFSAILIASAVMVIAARNPVHSVLFLILAFFNAAGLFLLLGAEFLAMILIVVYVGAVAVLFLFVVMMLDIDFAELTRTYASADCFLFPSLLEGFGFPPLEAMASGLPVVCSDRPSLPEVVGEAAITAPPNDRETLANAVSKVLTNETVAGDMRARGLAQAAQFSWARTASETVAAYRTVLGR